MKKFAILIILLFPLSMFSQTGEHPIDVHFYPHALSPQDNLQDGPFGKKIDIVADTFLIWVDQFPGMFFTHETVYILIAKDIIRIERGGWWPVLNGKTILYNEQDKYALISPFELPLLSESGTIGDKIEIHVYPHELTSSDWLADGQDGPMYLSGDNCLLLWADFMPGAFFAHATAYILISRENIRIEHGSWWPILNGKRILYGERNKTGIISPFRVSDSGGFIEESDKKENRIPR